MVIFVCDCRISFILKNRSIYIQLPYVEFFVRLINHGVLSWHSMYNFISSSPSFISRLENRLRKLKLPTLTYRQVRGDMMDVNMIKTAVSNFNYILVEGHYLVLKPEVIHISSCRIDLSMN